MQSFRDVYAAASEVKSVDDALAVIVEHRWTQQFGLRGDTVFELLMKGGVVCLTRAIFEAPHPLWFSRLVRELRDACVTRNISLDVALLPLIPFNNSC